jgi:predicted transcriptional regulator
VTIQLSPDLEQRLSARIAAGGYKSLQELVETALEEFLDDQEDPEELGKALDEAIREADAGLTVPLDEFDREMRARYGIPG